MRMPILDGWGVARDARRWAAEISADGYLSKP